MFETSITWVGDHAKYFSKDIFNDIIPSEYLTKHRTRFHMTLIKGLDHKVFLDILSYSRMFDGLTDVQFEYHRENETFLDFSEINLDKNVWYQYKIINNDFSQNTDYKSSIFYSGFEYVLEGFSLFSPVNLNNIPPCFTGETSSQKSSYMSLKSLPNPYIFSIVDIKLIQLFFFSTIIGLKQSTIFPYFFLFPLFTGQDPSEQITKSNILSVLSPCEVLIGLLEASLSIDSISDVRQNELIYHHKNYPSVLRVDDIKLESCKFTHHSPSITNFRHQNSGINSNIDYRFNFPSIDWLNSRKVHIPINNYFFTGLFPDISIYFAYFPLLIHHIRFHLSLRYLEQYLGIIFKDNLLLQCSLTHSTFHINFPIFGLNPVINRNFMSNICSPESQNINKISSRRHRFCKRSNFECLMPYAPGENSERLEFFGDTIIEFITTVALFHLFPDLSEGSMSIFRSAIVQNCHLSHLANKLDLTEFILMDPRIKEVLEDSQLDNICADAFESLFCAIYFDHNLYECQRLLGSLLWPNSGELLNLWTHLPEYPVITWSKINSNDCLNDPIFNKLSVFEESISIKFKYKHLLAKAFADPTVAFNSITCGSNQTLEFLGDAIIQFFVTKHLFLNILQIESVLTNLRSKIVNNANLVRIARELDLPAFIISQTQQISNFNIFADVFESLVAAIFLDGGFTLAETFCNAIFFTSDNIYSVTKPDFCLRMICYQISPLRKIFYKFLKKEGPANDILQTIGIYFGSQLLCVGIGRTRKFAKLQAIKKALSLLYNRKFLVEYMKL